MGKASFTASVESTNLAKVDELIEGDEFDYESRSEVLDDALESLLKEIG